MELHAVARFSFIILYSMHIYDERENERKKKKNEEEDESTMAKRKYACRRRWELKSTKEKITNVIEL